MPSASRNDMPYYHSQAEARLYIVPPEASHAEGLRRKRSRSALDLTPHFTQFRLKRIGCSSRIGGFAYGTPDDKNRDRQTDKEIQRLHIKTTGNGKLETHFSQRLKRLPV